MSVYICLRLIKKEKVALGIFSVSSGRKILKEEELYDTFTSLFGGLSDICIWYPITKQKTLQTFYVKFATNKCTYIHIHKNYKI